MSKFMDGACPVCAGTKDHDADCVYTTVATLRKRLEAAEADRDAPEVMCDFCYEDDCGGRSVCNCACHGPHTPPALAAGEKPGG